jgi:hypothetical protein
LDRPDHHDPRRLLPMEKPRETGLGAETTAQLYAMARSDPRFPPILKIRGKNYIIAADRDRYREQLISDALREAVTRKVGEHA